MKKAIALALACCMVLGLTACGDNTKKEVTETTPTPTLAAETVDYYYECGGSIELGEYKGLTYTKVSTEVTEEEIQGEIDNLLETYPNYVEDETKAGATIAEGDVVNLDYSGSVDGTVFEGGTATGYDLEIGSDSFIDGFEDALVGKVIGEEHDIDVTFPDPYEQNTDLSGKKAVFHVKLNYIAKEYDGITDTYINKLSNGSYETVEAYKTYLKDSMVASKKNDAQNKMDIELFESIVANSTFTLDDADVTHFYDQRVAEAESVATQYGMELDALILQTGYASADEFYAEAKTWAESQVKQDLVMLAIFEKEGLNLTDEEYKSRVATYMLNAGTTDQTTFETNYGIDYIKYCMKIDMAWEVIETSAVAKEATESTPEVTPEVTPEN